MCDWIQKNCLIDNYKKLCSVLEKENYVPEILYSSVASCSNKVIIWWANSCMNK